MKIKNKLKKGLFRGFFLFLPLAFLASLADAFVLAGIKIFMEILSGQSFFTLPLWFSLMCALAILRFFAFWWKTQFAENYIYREMEFIFPWYLRSLRGLSPRLFHSAKGDSCVEAAYESILILQNHGNVFFQSLQAVLQLIIFLPVLFYISWPLTLFLFAVIVPLIAWIQKKIHNMGPREEALVYAHSNFRASLNQGRRLFKKWSFFVERNRIFLELKKQGHHLNAALRISHLSKNKLSFVMEMISVLSMIFVLTFCALLIQKNWMNGTELVLFCSALLLCYKPVKDCAKVFPQLRSILSALKILEDYEALPEKKSTPCNNENILNVQNGNFHYENTTNFIYENFSLHWDFKKSLLLRGKNGTGKSTLLRLLASLENWEYGANSIAKTMCTKGVFFVAQDLELPDKKYFLECYNKNNKPLFASFFEKISLNYLLHKEGLSGGERAKIALAWALLSKAQILILDEPFASIALKEREILLREILNIVHAENQGLILASHDFLPPELESQFKTISLENAHENAL